MAGDRQASPRQPVAKGPRRRKGRRQRGGAPWLGVLVLGAIALLAIALYAVWQGSTGAKGTTVPIEVNGRPSIKVDKAQVNLGDIKLGKTVDTSFQVMNVGDQPLTISEKPYIEVVEGC